MYRNNKCRTCNHHHEFLPGTMVEGYEYDVGVCVYSFLNQNRCNCLNFVPFDNLEYLEYLYNKLETNNETARK